MNLCDNSILIGQFSAYIDLLRIFVLSWLLFWLIFSSREANVRRIAIYVSSIVLLLTVVRFTMLVFVLQVPML